MALKISQLTAGDVADLVAATSGVEVSNLFTTVPVTQRYTFGNIATWLRQVGFAVALTAVSPAAVAWGFTNASGADNAAGAFSVTAPLSSGNATSASYIIKVGQQVAGSSSILQTAGTGLTLSHTTAGGHLATFPNTVNVTGAIVSGGSITSGSSFATGSGGNIQITDPTRVFYWAGRTQLYSPADGILGLANIAGSGFTRLLFGPTTTGFTALSFAATTLSITLADGTGSYASFDQSAAAGDSRMLLYTVDTGTMQRVQTITNAAILTLLGLGAGRLLYVPA